MQTSTQCGILASAALAIALAVGAFAHSADDAAKNDAAKNDASKNEASKNEAAKFGPAATQRASARAAPTVERYLLEGRLPEGEKALSEHLKQQPKDDQARLELGALRFIRGVERAAQTLYRHGAKNDHGGGGVPILRIPPPHNPNPEKMSYAVLRELLQNFVDDMAAAEAVLAEIESSDVKLPLHFGAIHLDIDQDGKTSDEECLWKIYNAASSGVLDEKTANEFYVVFDKADATWLQGYCHVLMSLGEIALAYDSRELFSRTAHLAFERVDSPYGFLVDGQHVWQMGGSDIIDVIAVIHLLNFPLVEPQRMKKALLHLETVVKLSRQNWKELLAETDDDHEWIPNPRQNSVLPNAKVTDEMVRAWLEFLDETEAILAGKKLVPFWRANANFQGVNLRRVFTEPQKFDLVLWVQGTDALPYLEPGPLSQPGLWDRWNRLFNGQLAGYAFWFN